MLTLWRARLRASDRPERVFAAVRQVVHATGVLSGEARRAVDSTLLDDAVATQDTVTQLVAAIRRVRRLVPVATALQLAAHDYSQPGKPACAWDDTQARERLVSGLVTDALRVLGAVEDAELDTEQAEAVGLPGGDRRPRRRAGCAGRDLPDRPQGRARPGHQRGRSRQSAPAQVAEQLPRRLQDGMWGTSPAQP